MKRRDFLLVTGVATAIAGCTGQNEGNDETETTDTSATESDTTTGTEDGTETTTEPVPEFRLSQEAGPNSPVVSGTNTSVTLIVENTGTGSGETTVEFETGDVDQSEQVTLSPGNSESVTFEFQIPESGTYTYTVTETATSDSITNEFEVVDPARFSVIEADITPNDPVPNEDITLSVQVENVGGIEGSTTVEFEREDTNQSEEITLPAGNSESVTFEFQISEPGTYTYTVTESATGDSTTDNLEVVTPATFEFSDLEISPENPEPGEEITASVLVENTGDIAGNTTVEFELGDEQFTDDVTIEPGRSETASVTFFIRTQSEYELSVADLTTMVVTEYNRAELGEAYEGPDGLTVTLDSFEITEKTESYQYEIEYQLENNTDEPIDEGSFKLYPEDLEDDALPQYGAFDELFPGDSVRRSYVFEEMQDVRFSTLAYHHDQFFAQTPPSDAIKWAVNYE